MKIFSRTTIEIKNRWKTILIIALSITSAFVAGTFGSQLVIGAVQSLTGASVAVPAAELQILEADWALDDQTGLVTAVDVLVTSSSSTWQLKSYQLSVQVQCLAQSGTASPLTICSTGKTSIVLPTQGIGIRPLRINLAKAVSPALANIQNLNFAVTDLARIPPMSPTIFVGPTTSFINFLKTRATRLNFTVTGVSGIQPGTQVLVQLATNPKGVKSTGSQVLTLAPSPNQQGVLVARSSFAVVADADTLVGDTFIRIRAQTIPPQGLPPREDFALIGEKINALPAPEPSGANLRIVGLAYPGCADTSVPCAEDHSMDITVENNGTMAAGPFSIRMTAVNGTGVDECIPGNPLCVGLPIGRLEYDTVDIFDVSSELGLAAGAQVTRSVLEETIDPHCFHDPRNPSQCSFSVRVDYYNTVAESNEWDNSRDGILDALENLTPTIEPITNKMVGEGETLTVIPEASDADLPPQTLSYSLSGTAVAAGATIDPVTGTVSWVPDELDGSTVYNATIRVTDSLGAFAESSFLITVNEANQAPTILSITDKVLLEGQILRVVVTASDDDFPRQILTYRMFGTAAFAGATIDPSGVITWFTDEADGPGVYGATITVSDGLSGRDTSFFITVNEVNLSPFGLFWSYLNQTVDEGQTLTAAAFGPVVDLDLPRQTLTYSLSGTAFDAGATIDPSTGLVTWVTDATDGPGNYIATVRVTDTYDAFVQTSFSITVNEPIPIDQ